MTKSNVTTPDKHDLQQFTPEQIEAFVRRAIENDCGPALPDLLAKAAHIIRQLQAELARRDELDKQNFEALKACSLSARE